MSSRGSRRSGGSSFTADQINELVSKLRQLLPENHPYRRSDKMSASKVLEDTCNYIRELREEMDGLSQQLSQLLASVDAESIEAAIVRSLLM